MIGDCDRNMMKHERSVVCRYPNCDMVVVVVQKGFPNPECHL